MGRCQEPLRKNGASCSVDSDCATQGDGACICNPLSGKFECYTDVVTSKLAAVYEKALTCAVENGCDASADLDDPSEIAYFPGGGIEQDCDSEVSKLIETSMDAAFASSSPRALAAVAVVVLAAVLMA